MHAPRATVGLWVLTASALASVVLAQFIFLAWALAFVGFAILARDAAWRQGARIAIVTLATLAVIALPLSGISLGAFGRPLGGSSRFVTDNAIGASLGILAAPFATCLLLALAAPPVPRRFARAALVSGLLMAAVVLAMLRGERIAGLLALFGGAAMALLACALVAALWAMRVARPSVSA